MVVRNWQACLPLHNAVMRSSCELFVDQSPFFLSYNADAFIAVLVQSAVSTALPLVATIYEVLIELRGRFRLPVNCKGCLEVFYESFDGRYGFKACLYLLNTVQESRIEYIVVAVSVG